MAQLIVSPTDGTGKEALTPAANFVAASSPTSIDILLPSTGEGILDYLTPTAGSESPLARSTPEARIYHRQAVVEAPQEAMSSSRYVDPEAGSITAAFSRELASFYAALLTPVSPAARLFLEQTLVSSGDLSVLGRMTLEDMEQVRSVLATYTPAVSEFFPLYAARVVIAHAFSDELALRQATSEGFPVLLHAFQLLATAHEFDFIDEV